MQVALVRHVDVPGVLALQQLALGERGRRVREHAHLVGAPVRRQLRERAREQQVAGRGRDRAARGRPRPSGGRGAAAAPSSTSSWTSVAEWISSTATAARSTPSSPCSGSPAARKTSSGRSRLPPARIVAPACSASSSPCEPRERLEALLEPRHQRRDVRAAGLDERQHLLGAAHRTVPEWSAMMPPAVRIQRTSSSPAACHPRRQRLGRREALDRARQVGVGVGVAGDLAERRHDPVEPDREERRQRRPLRHRDLEHDDAPARPHDARHLGQPAVEVGEVARAEADGGGVEAVVRVRQLERIRPLPAHRGGLRARATSSIGSEKSDPTTVPGGPTRRASSTARSPVPLATSSALPPGSSAARSAARSRQRWCSPAVMTEFIRS